MWIPLLGYLYMAGSFLVACRLGWYMAFRLDRFDWRYARRAVWGSFAIWLLFWPLLVLRWREVVLEPRVALDADRYAAQEARFWDCPPPCGAYVRFQQAASLRQASACGEFVFRSDDVADWLTQRRVVDPDRLPEGDIQRWINTRDGQIIEPTDVPSIASRFEFIVDEMVRMGFGEVRCRRCNAQIPHEALIYSDDDGNQMSWNFNRILCPQGHPLLLVGMVHVSIDSDALVSAQGDGSGEGPASGRQE